jgi:hypothetical protein
MNGNKENSNFEHNVSRLLPNLQSKDDLQIKVLYEKITRFSTRFLISFSELENLVDEFIEKEINKSGFLVKILDVNSKILVCLNKIRFFNEKNLNEKENFQTSKESTKQWEEIKLALNKIYHPDEGFFRSIQDRFLFSINSSSLASILKKKSIITIEEELFIRIILIRSYLISFHHLIQLFYQNKNSAGDGNPNMEKVISYNFQKNDYFASFVSCNPKINLPKKANKFLFSNLNPLLSVIKELSFQVDSKFSVFNCETKVNFFFLLLMMLGIVC